MKSFQNVLTCFEAKIWAGKCWPALAKGDATFPGIEGAKKFENSFMVEKNHNFLKQIKNSTSVRSLTYEKASILMF